jgi:hypothetical protein
MRNGGLGDTMTEQNRSGTSGPEILWRTGSGVGYRKSKKKSVENRWPHNTSSSRIPVCETVLALSFATSKVIQS